MQQPASNLPDDFWALAYPRAYWPDVSAAAARHDVDPLLMLGLARQESHFDHMARSPVGAVGLFQVMPYTAAELDPAFSDPRLMERLVQPEVSAELAAKLLASLQARYQGALRPDDRVVQRRQRTRAGVVGRRERAARRAVHRQHSVSADARLRQAGADELRDVSALRTISIATKIIAIATAMRGVNRSFRISDPRITAITGLKYA